MTECVGCCYWSFDDQMGWMCSARYCIDDPLADYMTEQDEIWDEHTRIMNEEML